MPLHTAAPDRYRARVSGPLLDRIDLHVEVPRVAVQELAADTGGAEPPASALGFRRAPTRASSRVARTIADLAGDADVASAHLAEPIQHRTLDPRRPMPNRTRRTADRR